MANSRPRPLPAFASIDMVVCNGYRDVSNGRQGGSTLHKNMLALVVIASLAVGALAVNAVLTPASEGPHSGRVAVLEESAGRQRRAIEGLREEYEQQQKLVAKLLRFRTDANEQLAALARGAARLSGQGIYSGPVDNGQLQLGSEPAAVPARSPSGTRRAHHSGACHQCRSHTASTEDPIATSSFGRAIPEPKVSSLLPTGPDTFCLSPNRMASPIRDVDPCRSWSCRRSQDGN